MENLIPNIIIGIMAIATIAGFVYFVKPFFTKKERYRDSVGASRKQNELIGRTKKS